MALRALCGLLLFALAPSCFAQDANKAPSSSRNLLDCAWRASRGATIVRHESELEIQASELPRPAPRTVTCGVQLTGAAPFAVRGMQRGSVTEDGWTFSFQRADGAVVELNRGTQEGAFSFPVPAEWSGDREVNLVIGLPGENPGYVRFQNLSIENRRENRVQTPKPVSPAPNDTLSPAAADFFWLTPAGDRPRAYDVEYQRRGAPAQRICVPAYFDSDAMRVSPRAWLADGPYQWRVRATDAAGASSEWSRWVPFRTQTESASAEPDLHPSANAPEFVVNIESTDPQSTWRRLPPQVQAQTLIRSGGSVEQAKNLLEKAETSNISIALQVNGPHDIVSGKWDRLPLSLLGQWARKYRSLRAFYICEQAVQGGIHNWEVRDYLQRLITIATDSGRVVIWADANWGRNIWLDVAADAQFSSLLAKHRGVVFPVWKMNGGFVPYLAPAGLLGLWLRNVVAGWGVQPESWYWTEAGFGPVGTQHDFKEGVREDAPAVIYQQLALLGASGGAVIYSFEPSSDFFENGLKGNDNLQTILLPLLRMLMQRIVPDKAQVATAVTQWHTLQPADLEFRRNYSAPLHKLFSDTLGIGYPFEEIPVSGDSYWIPFVAATNLQSGPTWRTANPPAARAAGKLADQDAYRAAIFKVGQSIFVLNSRVNWEQSETLSIELPGITLTGELGLNGWIVILPSNSGDFTLWFSARPGARLELDSSAPVNWAAISDEGAGYGQPPGHSAAGLTSQHIELTSTDAPQEFLLRPQKK
jgi:hypothetical protein